MTWVEYQVEVRWEAERVRHLGARVFLRPGDSYQRAARWFISFAGLMDFDILNEFGIELPVNYVPGAVEK